MKYQDLAPFPSLISAMRYRQFCPFCHHGLEMCEARMKYDHGIYDRTMELIIELDQHSEHVLHINLYTEEIEVVISHSRDYLMPIYGEHNNTFISYNSRMGTSYIRYDGEMAHPLNFACRNKDCSQYQYVIQVWINLDTKKVSSVYLNSEFISLHENKTTHEIKNVYTIGKTYYNYYSGCGEIKSETFPLIEMDVENPLETLKRVKNLLIFA